MDELPFVSVLVVNYNGQSVLADCLKSLAQQSYPRERFEVIVVDNASTDDSLGNIRQQFNWVKLFASKTNTGFAEGNNIALSHAQGDWIALLNNDAMAEPDWLKKSVAIGASRADVGGIVGQLVFRDRPDVVNSTGLRLLPDGRGADRDFDQPVSQVKRPTGEVFGGCGAAVVLRRTMIDRIGLFDARLFMYYEDLDLAWRAQRAGWKFLYSPDIQVQHVFGATVGVQSPRQVQYVERNRTLVNLRHAPLLIAMATAIGQAARCIRALCRLVSGRSNTTSKHVAAHGKAMFSVIAELPRVVWQRINMPGSARGIYRRWSRSP